MTTETTHHTDRVSPASVQRSAVQVLADLIDQHPELPAAYVVIHTPWDGKPSNLTLQLDTPTGFEQWRTALGIAPDDVTLHPYGMDSWVSAEKIHEGIYLDIAAHGIALTDEQLNAPHNTQGVAV